ncbi:TIGR00269 family protein [Candidatus Micrarchaeota archaeon]|nr:TIGR00269 family protein [Candidatus Micrarchaeota archaeon]
MFCSSCKSPAIIYLPYSKTHLCEKHFKEMFDKRIRATIREFAMIKRNERIAVGLSGGKDSCVLLYSLARLRETLPFEIIAITIDEGIEGYRNKTLEFAKAECKKLGIEHHTFSYKKEVGLSLDEIMKKKGEEEIPCSYCGVMRRRLLNNAARELNADKLALGHNLDDIAQTVLMNIMRNEPQRLARLNEPLVEDEKFVPRIRPLMRTPEKEVAVYALTSGIEIDFQECPYARHAFRAHVREQLNETEEKYTGTKFKIVNSFFAMEKALRKGLAEDGEKLEMKYCKQCKEPSANEICVFCGMIEKLQTV